MSGRRRLPWWKGRKFIILVLLLQVFLITYFLKGSTPPNKHAHENNSGTHFLFIGIFSHRDNEAERQAIRDSWLKFPLPPKTTVKYKFIIGKPECRRENCELEFNQDKLKREIEKYPMFSIYNDILRHDVTEDRPTSRSELLWETYNWLEANLHYHYFLKIDDNMFFRLDLFYKEISQKAESQSVWSGFVWSNAVPTLIGKKETYKLEYLPAFAEGYSFYMSEDVVSGLAESRPAIFANAKIKEKIANDNNIIVKTFENHESDELGQSMAMWLLPFNITPIHDPRFQCGDVCSDKLFQKCKLKAGDIINMYKEVNNGGSPCELYSNQMCPVCMECEASQRHWKIYDIECDSSGATRRYAKAKDSDTLGILGYLPVLQCDYQKLEDAELGLNFVKEGRGPTIDSWTFVGNAETVPDTERGTDCVQITSSFYTTNYITQEIELKQTHPEPIVISGWSKAEAVEPSQKGDYSIYADFTFSDGSKDDAFIIDFDDGTHEWQYGFKIYNPSRPISHVTLRCTLRYVLGTAWFDQISVMTLSTALCTLKHQSQLFGDFQSPFASFNSTTTVPKKATLDTKLGAEIAKLVDSNLKPVEGHESSSQKLGTNRFFFVWTSPPDSFKLRNRRSIESVFFHQPGAHVSVYSNILPLNFFHEFNSAGYDVQVVRYNIHSLVEGVKGQSWVKEMSRWSLGTHFYTHLADFLKFIVLFKYGGVYMDFDLILMKPFTAPKNHKGFDIQNEDKIMNLLPAEVCGNNMCVHPGDESIKTKYYVPMGFISMEAGHPLISSALSFFEFSYDPDAKHAERYLSAAYSDNAVKFSDVTILPFKAIYPIPEKEIAKYFKQDNFERWKSIQAAGPHAFHFWGTATSELQVSDFSLMKRALSDYSISNTRDKANLLL